VRIRDVVDPSVHVRFWPIADVRPIEAGSAVLMSAIGPKRTFALGVSGAKGFHLSEPTWKRD
jgi:hypothetical protein